jgi:hypothetical protein
MEFKDALNAIQNEKCGMYFGNAPGAGYFFKENGEYKFCSVKNKIFTSASITVLLSYMVYKDNNWNIFPLKKGLVTLAVALIAFQGGSNIRQYSWNAWISAKKSKGKINLSLSYSDLTEAVWEVEEEKENPPTMMSREYPKDAITFQIVEDFNHPLFEKEA